MALPDEIDLSDDRLQGLAAGPYNDLTDAIDAASDQDHVTWIINGGKRIAKIAPVDEIPDDLLERGRDRISRTIDRLTAKRQEIEPVWIAGQVLGLLQVTARQVEEIHRTLGLERDENGDPVAPAGTPADRFLFPGQVQVRFPGARPRLPARTEAESRARESAEHQARLAGEALRPGQVPDVRNDSAPCPECGRTESCKLDCSQGQRESTS